MEHGHAGDPAGSTALITERIISLKAADAKEPSNSNADRKSYGNNRYLYLNLLQWLNSEAAAGAWYAAQHSVDQAPNSANVWSSHNPYDTEAGFLSNFSAGFKKALLTATKRTVKSSTDGGGYEDISKKIHLLSTTEVGLANENGVAEGTKYALFSDNTSRCAKPTAQAVSKSTYTNSSLNANANWYWWLRTPYAGNAYSVRIVNSDGSLNDDIAYYGDIGARPACFVSSSLSVSDSPGADGAYTITFNAPPTLTISGNKNLGDKNSSFSFSYSVADAEGDAVSVSISIDGVEKHSAANVSKGTPLTFTVTSTILAGLALGAHTITVKAQDATGSVTDQLTFTKIRATAIVSGADADLGPKWFPPVYKYTVSDSDGYYVTATEYLDGKEVRVIHRADAAGELTFDLSGWDTLSDEAQHEMVIKAINTEEGEAVRRITFRKLADRLSFQTKPIATDAAVERIVAMVDYDKTGNPRVQMEVTNDAFATTPTWEDMTDEWKKSTAHYFTHKPTAGLGVSFRITIFKNESTQRVYCNNFGFSFD